MSLVLVVGPPRSGTSVVARLLHKIGICMGHNLVPGNEGNPLGFYEDSGMVGATKSKNVLTWISALHCSHMVPNAWMYSDCGKPKGVKTPELAFMEMSELNPDLVIRTCRQPLAVADSLERWQQPKLSSAEALSLVVKYEKAIDEQVPRLNCYRVDLTKRRDEDELEEELRRVCSSVVQGRIHGS